jgi:hypothetical protein
MNQAFPYDDVLTGKGETIPFPEDPFARWEIVHQFPERCETVEMSRVVFIWFIENAPIEWSQFFVSNLMLHLRNMGNIVWLNSIGRDPRVQQFVREYAQIVDR